MIDEHYKHVDTMCTIVITRHEHCRLAIAHQITTIARTCGAGGITKPEDCSRLRVLGKEERRDECSECVRLRDKVQ